MAKCPSLYGSFLAPWIIGQSGNCLHQKSSCLAENQPCRDKLPNPIFSKHGVLLVVVAVPFKISESYLTEFVETASACLHHHISINNHHLLFIFIVRCI